jgi:hypothetical protein
MALMASCLFASVSPFSECGNDKLIRTKQFQVDATCRRVTPYRADTVSIRRQSSTPRDRYVLSRDQISLACLPYSNWFTEMFFLFELSRLWIKVVQSTGLSSSRSERSSTVHRQTGPVATPLGPRLSVPLSLIRFGYGKLAPW